MISKNCDFKMFIEAVKNKDHMEVVYLAEQEATRAERLALRSPSNPEEKQKCGREYSGLLKGLIQYLRYSIKPKLPEGHDYQVFI
jgi:hypothetical protein